MAILDTETTGFSAADRAATTVCPVTVKLTQEEHRAVTDHAEELGQARSEWMRDVILRELQTSSNDPLLEEIAGIRLLLINVLRRLVGGQEMAADAFDRLLEQVGATTCFRAVRRLRRKRLGRFTPGSTRHSWQKAA